jgi:glycosyltransferase involved in cell wall biosynthesis
MLAILTPVFRTCEPDFLGSLFKTLGQGGATWIHVQGHANLARSRNYLVQEARDRKAEHVLFIDADIGWEPEAVGQLFDCPDDARIVAACPQRREDGAIRFASTPDANPKRQGQMVTGTAATAFMRVATSVFDELEPRVPHYHYQGRSYPAFFQTPIALTASGKRELLDEDVYFSGLCKANGIDVWLNPTIPLRHWHTTPLTALMADHMNLDPLKDAV